MAFVEYRLPCNLCGGSDPVALNEDGSGFCFSCNTLIPNYNGDNVTDFSTFKRNNDVVYSHAASSGEFYALTDRSISLDTAKKYGVRSVKNSVGDVVEHSYPYYINNETVSSKVRKADKTFSWTSPPKGAGLFGQQLFQTGSKYITLVEGECDAMAAYELHGSQWPVVSIKNGAASAERDVKENLEFLESFETVVINFDNDTAGIEAAKKVARLLKPGKAKIMQLPTGFKDANDMLRKRQHTGYVQAWWNAKLYTPSGVLNVSESVDDYFKRERKASVPYPWEGLNKKLEGLRMGELLTLTGGTGLGKSSVTRELEHWLIKQTKDNVGVIALEENWQRTIDGIMSIEMDARLHLDSVRNLFEEKDLRTVHETMFSGENKDRVWVYGHLGMNDLESVFSKLRYMIIGCDCKWIVLDHLHMLVMLAQDPDERKAIDTIMHRLRTLVEETGCGLILVSHLRRVDGNKGHENGIETGLSHLRGSQSIAQLSDCVISLERNQQADNPIEASTTKMRVLKSRYTGDVGVATHLIYNKDSGRLSETDMFGEEDELGDII
tara:strand:- start:2451 stop:4106 length:1656 start_codon:yes stop_codon:yes gene_type:complete